jgi:O-antigen/teichoic acid export membrane protein
MSTAGTFVAESRPNTEPIGYVSHMGKISRQSGVFFAGTLFSVASAYFFKIYLARVLGAEGLGLYALGITLVGFLGVFNALGLPQAAVRFVSVYTASGKHNHLYAFIGGSVLLLLGSNLLLGGLLLLVGPWFASRFYRTPSLSGYLPLFAGIMLLGCMTTFLGQVLAGFKDVARRTVITNFVGNPLTILFSVVLIVAGLGLRGYLLAQLGSALVVLLLLVTAIWRIAPAKTGRASGVTSEVSGAVLSFSAAAFGIGIMEFFLAQADKVVIGLWLNAREVGIYAMATAIVTFVPVVLQSVNQIFSPTIADLHSRGQTEMLARLFQTLTKWVLGLTLPLATAVVVFAQPLMRVFGKDFESGWPILVVGVVGQLVNCGVGSVGYLLLMSGHQNRLVKIQAVMTVVTVALNLVLIPGLGIMGAALAAATTNVISNVWYLRQVRHSMGISPYNRGYKQMLIPTLAMVSTTVLLRTQWISIKPFWIGFLLGLAVAYVVFILVMLALGLDEDDRLVVSSVWTSLRGSIFAAEAT